MKSMERLKNDKDEYQRNLHAIMAMIGGFLGGYAILTRMDLFGNAQTANMMYVVISVLGKNFTGMFLRVCGVLIYMCGVAISVIWKKRCAYNIHCFSIIVDIMAIIISGFIPRSVPPVVALYPVFFAMPIQWNSFTGAYGYNSSPIFSTNNLRQFTMGITEYLTGHDIKQLHKACIYGKVLLFYHIGVLLSYYAVKIYDVRGVWFGLVITAVAALKIIGEEKEPWVKKEMKLVEECVKDRKTECVRREI